MANSSPPTRATVSWLRTVSTRRWLDLLDQVVPGGVPEGVVDRLEVVEVDEEHAHRLADPARPHQLLFDPVLEEPAVGQPGEGVVPGHVGDLLQQLEVLEGGGGLVGQTEQPLVEVGVVDGGAEASAPKLAAMTPRNSPAANSGATTEAAMPDGSSSARSSGSSVDGVEDDDLPLPDHPVRSPGCRSGR